MFKNQITLVNYSQYYTGSELHLDILQIVLYSKTLFQASYGLNTCPGKARD